MKRQSTKRLVLVLVAAAAIVSLSACGSKAQPLQSSESSNSQDQAVSNNGGGNADETANGGSSNGTENTGNASTNSNASDAVNAGGTSNQGTTAEAAAPEKKKEEISVYYTDDQMIDLHAQKTEIEYGDTNERLTAAFEALQKDSDKGEASLWKKAKLLSVKQDGDAVTIDVHLPDEARLGAPGEQLAIAAVTQTFFQFKDVASLDILVDGKAESSLMGHEDLEHPIKKQ